MTAIRRLLIVLMLGGGSLWAQPELGYCEQEVDEVAQRQVPRAQEAWARGNMREAERYLKQALRLKKDYADALYLLGHFQIRKGDIRIAKGLWSTLKDVCPDYSPDLNFYLGVIYVEDGKHEKAIALLEEFLESPERDFGLDPQAKAALEEAELRKRLYANPVPFDPQPLPNVSTSADEYLATISPDQQTLYFTRKMKRVNRKDGPAAKVRMVEEFTKAVREADGEFERGKPMQKPFNKNYNEGGPTVTADNTELYFTVCRDREGYKNCDIFYSEKDDVGYWTTPRGIGDHINRRNSWESQPTVSANGDYLYFTSDRDTGIGGLDIYVCKRKLDGSWGDPEILPETINTRKDEKSPFIHPDGKSLYFTSNGHPGLGGFDIFYSQLRDSVWQEPVNIGYPINGKKDDLGLFVSLDGQFAYFSSNNIDKEKGWDIYRFELPQNTKPRTVSLITGTIDKSNNPDLKNTAIEIRNLKSKRVANLRVDEQTGRYAGTIELRPKEDVILTVKKKGAAFSSTYVGSGKLQKQKVVDTRLEVEELVVGKEYELNDIKFATNSYQLNEVSRNVIDEFVRYLQENPSVSADIQGHTDNVGDAQSNLTLSRNRARVVYNYVVEQGISPSRLSYHGYGENKPIADNSTAEGRAQNRRTVFVVTSQ